MIEVFIDKRFGVRTSVAIERHVHNKYRNVLPRNAQLYYVALRPPNYPVPAIRANHLSGGGVEGDCYRNGAWFIDWSRGSIEVY